eukprot:CAMPEP_0198209262 /NCGR_PEP_ID=MMETSP1445-20131203/14804_1 /TAXON_ID=36898 /ORGANISM="Pyramimonas sp., Strain CCMP2087" /LENGTH=226 /DNA_ID=CAMNT_0043882983 /DNA_START=159 /DNA_END=839 /DNA_ORIENTATION=-
MEKSTEVPSTPSARKALKVVDLKAILAEKGLETDGVKAILLQRLEDSLPAPDEEVAVSAVTAETATEEQATEEAAEAQVTEVVASKATEVKAAPAEDAGKSATELEKKKARASRFGVPLASSEDEKLATRASRFGIPPGEDAKKASRSARFGTTEAKGEQAPKGETEEDKAKRLARAKRFGTNDPSLEEDKKKARADRFSCGLTKKEQEDFEAKKSARAARFAGKA